MWFRYRLLVSNSESIQSPRSRSIMCSSIKEPLSSCVGKIFWQRMMAEPPEDIKKLFDQYTKNSAMTIEDLERFLVEFQGESDPVYTKERAKDIFNSLKHLDILQRRSGLNFNAFLQYLLGDLNPPLFSKVHHDMTAPLNHYFLFTSYKSYLTRNQLRSDSSIDPINSALLRGVRVIELDLWPNSSKTNVEVRHGGTLTLAVELYQCLVAIKENAFIASEYPVVIMFENHLPADLQAKVVKMVNQTFGKMLYSPYSAGIPQEFPSPESLKGKILISTKPEKFRKAKKSEVSDDKSFEQDDQDEDDEDDDDLLIFKQLIVITYVGKPIGGLDMWRMDPLKVRCLSLSNQELQSAATDITVRFTQRNLLRVHPNQPKPKRLDSSSNYDPMLGWMYGAQMASLSMQEHGEHLWVTKGMFRANGGCGYVKKPNRLLTEDRVFNPYDKSIPVTKILKVTTYMGEGWHSDFRGTHFDLDSPPEFFVRVGIAGVPRDAKIMVTKAVENKWIPVWNQEFDFPLSVPELAVLLVEVKEYDASGNHDFGGQTCLPISELKPGIRAVPLSNRRGQQYKSVRLLMRFKFENVSQCI